MHDLIMSFYKGMEELLAVGYRQGLKLGLVAAKKLANLASSRTQLG